MLERDGFSRSAADGARAAIPEPRFQYHCLTQRVPVFVRSSVKMLETSAPSPVCISTEDGCTVEDSVYDLLE